MYRNNDIGNSFFGIVLIAMIRNEELTVEQVVNFISNEYDMEPKNVRKILLDEANK